MQKRPWVLISAYDVSVGESSEGYVAFNVIRRLCENYRIILITRCNNKKKLEATPDFSTACPSVHLVGYDLPKWVAWWKRGARFYQLYAYLWQMIWPEVVRSHTKLCGALQLIHVLNFHNDSIPSLAWRIGPPVVWGPVNHNEIVASWRRTFWPFSVVARHVASFGFRCLLWRTDLFLRLHVRNSRVVLSAGEWVDQRLGLARIDKVIHRSQLGTSADIFRLSPGGSSHVPTSSKELICAGRLDWIKGVDLAIEAVALLPDEFRLRIVGKGAAETRLRTLAKQLGIEARVMFQAPVTRSTLSDLYAQADQFLFTSAEVAGLAWVEALACGLPVVAFEGRTEIANAARTHPGIRLVPAGGRRCEQIEKLAATIRAAAEMPRNPTELRAAVMKRYNWDGLTDTIREAYRRALAVSS